MICERCRRRFGRIGENYWTAKAEICPICEETLRRSSVSVCLSQNKKLG